MEKIHSHHTRHVQKYDRFIAIKGPGKIEFMVVIGNFMFMYIFQRKLLLNISPTLVNDHN